MAEPPKCPTSHCDDKGKPMPPAGPRRHDKDRKITRYKCPTCGQEITQRTA
jgi:predicted SprT family Zn-dependent metalloprotease